MKLCNSSLLTVAAWLLGLTAASRAIDLNSNSISDVWERKYPSAAASLLLDADGDGRSNRAEGEQGTNPFDGKDYFGKATFFRSANGAITLTWRSLANRFYQIEESTDLATWNPSYDANYASYYAYGAPGTNTAHTWLPVSPAGPKKFFRVNPNPFNGASYDSSSDGDSLVDWEEEFLGTNPLLADTDGDLMDDAFEFTYNFNPLSAADGALDTDGDLLRNNFEFRIGLNPRLADTGATGISDAQKDADFDLLSNVEEQTRQTDPTQFDTDGDTLPDGFEVLSPHLNPLVYNNPNLDFDADGMSDSYEAIYGFNPDVNDSALDGDGDGLTTAAEGVYGTDPADPDTDSDELTDLEEQQHGTDPWTWDTDSDELPDKWELDYNLNPLIANDPLSDTDADGLGLYQEYRHGTNPNLADSDADGTSDGAEVTAGTSPNDPSWGGTPAPPLAPTAAATSSNLTDKSAATLAAFMPPATASSNATTPPVPETYQVAFEVGTSGKKPLRSCATCHSLKVKIDGALYDTGVPATLLKGKSYEVRVRDTPVRTRPNAPKPPHSDTAEFTVLPVAVDNETIAAIPAGSEDPTAFIATENDVVKYIIGNGEHLLVQDQAWPSSKAQEPTKKKAAVGSVELGPDEAMAGVVGDMVDSVNPVSKIKHFVTPKKTTELAQEYVILKATGITAAQITPGGADQVLEWEGGLEVPAQPLKRWVKRDTAAKTVVKIKAKDGGAIAVEMNVWVVWADCTTTPGSAHFNRFPGLARYEVFPQERDGWRFKFKITPASICDPNTPERPDLSGDSRKPVPGRSKIYTTNSSLGDCDTAKLKWDLSRQFKYIIRNPNGISRGNLYSSGLPPAWIVNQPVAFDNPISFPLLDIEGNDDPLNDPLIDEDANPYQEKHGGSPLNHAIGEITSFDAPGAFAADFYGRAGFIFSQDYNFREFARFELWDGKREGGQFWFRISKQIEWHHYFNTTFDSTNSTWKDGNPNSSCNLDTPNL
jgi:Bacterial TSP3 repeat